MKRQLHRLILLVMLLFASALQAQVNESFSNIPTNSSSSYRTRDWTGDDGFTWQATNTRTDKTINGKAICIKGEGHLINSGGPVAGGCGTLSFKYRKFYSGSSTLQVFINGTQYGGDITVSVNSVKTFSETINIPGNIDIEIKNITSGKRVGIDDLSWTSYTTNDPTILVSPASLTGFTYVEGSGPSPEQTFTVEGSNLTNDITLTAPTNWEISTTSGSGFTNSITLTQSGGNVSSTTIYVRLAAGLLNANSPYSGNIVCSSAGATDKNVSLEGTVTLGCVEPTKDAVFHANSPQNLTTTSATLNWDAGDGEHRIVVMKAGSAITSNPVDGTTYNADTAFGNGSDIGTNEYVVYKGDAETVDITNLTPGTEYYVKIFEFNCDSGNEDYYTSGTPAEDIFITEPEKTATFTTGCVGNTDIHLSWTAPTTGGFDGYLLVVREDADPHSVNGLDPSTNLGDNLDYSAAATYGSTTPNSRILYKGTNTDVTVTGLTEGTTYKFRIFTYKTGVSGYKYSSGRTRTQEIKLTDVTNASALGLNAEASVSWTNPETACFDEILVVANETAGIDFTPSGDGSSYTANTVYAAPNQVVFKGTGTNVSVTSLTNGTTYYFEIFVRKGTQWSDGVEVSATPEDAPVLESGDLAIVAVNTNTGSGDEICFFSFKDISKGTSIDFTDNGYERATAGLWGDSEGTIRIIRSDGGVIPKGQVICIQGAGSTPSGFHIRVCGADDTANWTIQSLNGQKSFNLSATDQVWLMQNGTWNNPSGNNDADYTGKILCGWTGSGWEENPGYNSASGSTMHPGLNCFSVNVENQANSDRIKYNGDPSVSKTQVEWIKEISKDTNWQGYSSTTDYNAGTNDYANSCVTFNISGSGGLGAPEWDGTKDSNWFDCANWKNLKVPDKETSAIIPSAATNTTVIVDHSATFASQYNGVAACDTLVINDNIRLQLEKAQDTLKVYGDLNIKANGVLDMDDGDNGTADGNLYVYKSWHNEGNDANFEEGQGNVYFGDGFTEMTTADPSGAETFYNLILGTYYEADVTNSSVIVKSFLKVNQDQGFYVGDDHYAKIDGNITNDGEFIVEDKGALVQTDNNATISGAGTFEMNKISKDLNHYYDYVYWSTPINSSSFTMGELVDGAWRYYSFNPANQDPNEDIDPGWTWETAASTFENGHGYAISSYEANGSNPLEVTFGKNSDPFNNGVVSVNVGILGTGATDNDDWNFLGNPYPSAIDFDAFANDNGNIQGSVYLWTNCAGLDGNLHQESGYTAYTVGSGAVSACSNVANTASRYIASGQGFFVEANAAGNVSFKNEYRITNHNDNFLNRPETKDRIWLDLTDSNYYYNQILVGFFENATNEKDRLFDAHAINGGFYSLIGDENYVIQGLPNLDENDKMIPLGFESDGNSTITIHINRLEGELENRDVYLKDLYENVYHNLKTNDYVFTSSDGTFNDRLQLWIVQSTQSIDETNLNLFTLWQDGDTFNIKTAENANISDIIIYDELGRELFNQNNINTDLFRYDASHLPVGNMLLFKVTLKNGQTMTRKTIKR